MRQERDDGLATFDWVVQQPWFGDAIVLLGASYLGYVQLAVADRLPPQVKAMIPQVDGVRVDTGVPAQGRDVAGDSLPAGAS